MKLPLQITFRNIESTQALEHPIREKAEKLNQFFSDIMRCHVIVEARHKHHQQGNIYDVHIDITVPGKELVVSREAGRNHAHEDILITIRDAFDAARRQLRHHAAQVSVH